MTKDDILRECSLLFSNMGKDSTKEVRKEAKEREWALLEKLKDIAPEDYKFYKETRDKR